ncbi:hypothetical protein [Amycolatopsis suaedae]|uniref:Uncharacterized protein n=1 Tax=Amycolatopsis suaedae TaxID=2510978 RepID=A0A4Q7J612_9PSEU|nr:hypothetical protein [Amycolatopsis suaedae]RZQ63031.1 hypothetical protein EWH70_15180 [Amycolatopsis suaedae]
MSRTTVIIIAGLVLVVVFLAVGALVRAIGLKRAAEDFLLVWLAIALFNMAVGVFEAGYTVAEELPVLGLIFAVPGVVAFAAWLYARRRA